MLIGSVGLKVEKNCSTQAAVAHDVIQIRNR